MKMWLIFRWHRSLSAFCLSTERAIPFKKQDKSMSIKWIMPEMSPQRWMRSTQVLRHAIPFSCTLIRKDSSRKKTRRNGKRLWHVLRVSAPDVRAGRSWCSKRRYIERKCLAAVFFFFEYLLGLICGQASLSDAINTHMIAIMRYICINQQPPRDKKWMHK